MHLTVRSCKGHAPVKLQQAVQVQTEPAGLVQELKTQCSQM